MRVDSAAHVPRPKGEPEIDEANEIGDGGETEATPAGEGAFAQPFVLGGWPGDTQAFAQPLSLGASAPTATDYGPSEPLAADAVAEIQRRFANAHQSFLARLQDALAPAEVQQRLSDAQAAYAGALQQALASPAVQQRIARAYADFAETVNDAFTGDEVRERVREAFATYVEDVRAAWVELSPADLDAISVAAAAESMASVAWLTLAGTSAASTASDAS